MLAAWFGALAAFLAALGLAGLRIFAAAVLSCAGVCSFFSGAALLFVIPLNFDAPLTARDRSDLEIDRALVEKFV